MTVDIVVVTFVRVDLTVPNGLFMCVTVDRITLLSMDLIR